MYHLVRELHHPSFSWNLANIFETTLLLTKLLMDILTTWNRSSTFTSMQVCNFQDLIFSSTFHFSNKCVCGVKVCPNQDPSFLIIQSYFRHLRWNFHNLGQTCQVFIFQDWVGARVNPFHDLWIVAVESAWLIPSNGLSGRVSDKIKVCWLEFIRNLLICILGVLWSNEVSVGEWGCQIRWCCW